MTPDDLARLGHHDLPPLGDIDGELIQRATDAGKVVVKMTGSFAGRRPGEVFFASEDIAQGYEDYGVATRLQRPVSQDEARRQAEERLHGLANARGLSRPPSDAELAAASAPGSSPGPQSPWGMGGKVSWVPRAKAQEWERQGLVTILEGRT